MEERQPGQIGRYKIVGELGRGGFGRVYRGYDPVVGRPVAVKILTQLSEDSRTRFRNEAAVAGNLGHKNIVTVYEYGTHEGLPFLAMEYLDGQDLHQIIASRRPLSLLRKCNIMSEVAEGLHCAHQSGVVHRDMKPANIMVLRDGGVRIMDFGIARLTSTPDATRLTQQGYLVGTLRYMAPEQLAGSDFDALCDIFAYGLVFYELLAGRHPFEAVDAQNLMYKLTFEEAPPIRNFAPDVPKALQEVVLKTIHKDRARRYQSLREVQLDTEPTRIELQQEYVAAILKQAKEMVGRNELEAAQGVVHEALALEPSNRAARALHEELKKQPQRSASQERMQRSIRVGEQHLVQRRFTDAVRAFEQALVVDPGNSSILARVEHARGLVEHSRKASQLLAEARKELEQQNVTAAYRSVSMALRHDPKNPEAAEFLRTIQVYVDGRQAEQRVDDIIRKAQGLMLIPDFDGAIATLTSAGPDAESPRILAFLERVRTERLAHERKQKIRNEIARATDLLRDRRRLEEAALCLENLQREFPDDRDVSQLLAYVQRERAALARAKTVERVATEAHARAESRDFEGALAVLDRALHEHPGESALIRLLSSTMAAKDAWERQQAIEAILVHCESLRSNERYEEATRALETALENYADEPLLLDLLKQVQAQWGEQRRARAIRQVCEETEVLLNQSQPEAAVRRIEQALTRHSGDRTLSELFRRAQDAVLAQKKARAVSAIGSEAASHAAANEFEEALRILDKGLETWRNDPELLRQRSTILEARTAWEGQVRRAAAIDKLGREALARADTGDFDGALALLAQGLQNWPDASSLSEIRNTIVTRAEARRKRDRSLKDLEEIRLSSLRVSDWPEPAKLLSRAISIASQYGGDDEIQTAAAGPIALLSDIGRARKELVDRKFQPALDICEGYLAQFPDHPAFRELKGEVERAQRRVRVNEDYQRATAEPDLEKRAAILQELLERHPGEALIEDELRLARNKLALIHSIAAKARDYEELGLWAEAVEQWRGLLNIYDQYPGLDSHIERVRRAQEEQAQSRYDECPASRASTKAAGEERDIAAAPASVIGLDPQNRQRKRKRIPALIGLGVVLSGGTYMLRVFRRPTEAGVHITSSASGAPVPVGANDRPPATKELPIEPDRSPVNLQHGLEPLPQLLHVNTNFENGQVYVDGRLAGTLTDGRYTASGMTPGRHSIRVTGSGASFEADWRMAADAVPELLKLGADKHLETIMLASAGATASLACNCVDQPISVDGTPVAKTPASAGLPVALHGLKPGTRQIALGKRSLIVEVSATPTLNVVLSLDRNLAVKKGEGKLTLTPAPAYLEIAGAVPGVQVKLDGQPIGETDRNGAFRHSVAPGGHSIELTKPDYAPERFVETFLPGKVVLPVPAQVAMVKNTKNAPPDPRIIEVQDWAQVVNSGNLDDFEAFLRKHPAGAHAEEARNRAVELHQLSQANAARQAEQNAWIRVDQNNREQLQNHLSRFPAGFHAQEARARIAELDRESAEALSAQRLREEKEGERAKNAADERAVVNILKEFESAYNRKDLAGLQRLWGEVPAAAYRQQFREATNLKFQLQVVGQPALTGNSAVAACIRTLTYQGRSGGPQTYSERVNVRLSREASGWRIRSIKAN